MRRTLIMSRTIVFGALAVSSVASAQEWMVNSLTIETDVVAIEDGALVQCTVSEPCVDATLVIDTPVWSQEDLSGFRRDLQDLVAHTEDTNLFINEPRLVFTNLTEDCASTPDYVEVIFDELDPSEADLQIELSSESF